jgi:hypothetical protein
MGDERIVTQPFVPEVCWIRVRSEVLKANCAAGCPRSGVATSAALTLTPPSFSTLGLMVRVDLPHPSTSNAHNAPATPMRDESGRAIAEPRIRRRTCARSSNPFMIIPIAAVSRVDPLAERGVIPHRMVAVFHASKTPGPGHPGAGKERQSIARGTGLSGLTARGEIRLLRAA